MYTIDYKSKYIIFPLTIEKKMIADSGIHLCEH